MKPEKAQQDMKTRLDGLKEEVCMTADEVEKVLTRLNRLKWKLRWFQRDMKLGRMK